MSSTTFSRVETGEFRKDLAQLKEIQNQPSVGYPHGGIVMQRRKRFAVGSVVGALMIAAFCGSRAFADPPKKIQFDMVPSTAAASCLANASGQVVVMSRGPVEAMNVNVSGLPPNTDFDFFVIQQPNAPFGMSWYQGDIITDDEGNGEGRFIGRFSIETFIVAPAPGNVPAPQPHDGRDASSSPPTLPVHTFHLGLWFNSPTDAAAAGCPGATTPFNGDHTAGVQALSTRNFPALEGPLGNLQP